MPMTRKSTERTFGGYVSVYDFATAVEDGATVPLFHENRSDLLEGSVRVLPVLL